MYEFFRRLRFIGWALLTAILLWTAAAAVTCHVRAQREETWRDSQVGLEWLEEGGER